MDLLLRCGYLEFLVKHWIKIDLNADIFVIVLEPKPWTFSIHYVNLSPGSQYYDAIVFLANLAACIWLRPTTILLWFVRGNSEEGRWHVRETDSYLACDF